MYHLFLRSTVIFLSPGGWGGGFLGQHMCRGGAEGGGRISCHQKSIKGDYRILTADEEGGGVTRILESLIGESGKFYLDIAQILQPTPPPPFCS